MPEYHIPVMLQESISALVTNPSGIYADCTFGGGGHTAALLSRLQNDGGKVIAFDRDSDALTRGEERFAEAIQSGALRLVRSNFRYIENHAAYLGVTFDGILADLGVSSHQFDTPERGFSFRFDAPLDMRMNPEGEHTAADLISDATEEQLQTILRRYGEVEGAGAMARLIVKAREKKPIRTTQDLNEAIARMLPAAAPHKVLSKVYQALRIQVNGEMDALEHFLDGAVHVLKPGGRLVVITYHSLEDRMVKNFIRTGNIDGTVQKDVFGKADAPLTDLLRKGVTPAEAEIAANTRARSARLRAGERRAER